MEYILNCKENGRILCKNETFKPKFHAHRNCFQRGIRRLSYKLENIIYNVKICSKTIFKQVFSTYIF